MQARRQEVFGKGIGGAHAELGAAALAEQLLGTAAQGVEGLSQGRQVAAPGFGQAQTLGFADEQAVVEMLLKLLDLLADGGLGDMQLFGRAGKAAQARGGLEGRALSGGRQDMAVLMGR